MEALCKRPNFLSATGIHAASRGTKVQLGVVPGVGDFVNKGISRELENKWLTWQATCQGLEHETELELNNRFHVRIYIFFFQIYPLKSPGVGGDPRRAVRMKDTNFFLLHLFLQGLTKAA